METATWPSSCGYTTTTWTRSGPCAPPSSRSRSILLHCKTVFGRDSSGSTSTRETFGLRRCTRTQKRLRFAKWRSASTQPERATRSAARRAPGSQRRTLHFAVCLSASIQLGRDTLSAARRAPGLRTRRRTHPRLPVFHSPRTTRSVFEEANSASVLAWR